MAESVDRISAVAGPFGRTVLPALAVVTPLRDARGVYQPRRPAGPAMGCGRVIRGEYTPRAMETSPGGRLVVVVVWDGLRPDFLTPEVTPTLLGTGRRGRLVRGESLRLPL